MSNAEGHPMRTALLIGLGLLVALIIFVWWRYGAQGIAVAIKQFLMWSLILLIIAGIVFLVIWLFQTKRIDMIEVHRERIIEACELNATPYAQTLSFRAYGDDWAVRKVGRVLGACMILARPIKDEVIDLDDNPTRTPLHGTYARMVFITFQPPGILNRVLGVKHVVAGLPNDFSTLSGEVVWMHGMTFSPPLYKILFLSHHWENRAFIDETIRSNIYRYTIQENLKEMASLMEEAIEISPRHKKTMEQQNIQTLPVPGQQPPPQR